MCEIAFSGTDLIKYYIFHVIFVNLTIYFYNEWKKRQRQPVKTKKNRITLIWIASIKKYFSCQLLKVCHMNIYIYISIYLWPKILHNEHLSIFLNNNIHRGWYTHKQMRLANNYSTHIREYRERQKNCIWLNSPTDMTTCFNHIFYRNARAFNIKSLFKSLQPKYIWYSVFLLHAIECLCMQHFSYFSNINEREKNYGQIALDHPTDGFCFSQTPHLYTKIERQKKKNKK